MNFTKAKTLPLTARILRPVPKYFYQCTEETQRGIKNLGMVLLFTVTVCGAIFAASICEFCLDGDYSFFVPVFAITAFFYYLIDKPIIFSDLNKNQRLIRRLRVFIALILGLFNSFLIDTFYFKDDIAASRNIEISQRAKEIRADYARIDSVLYLQKSAFITQIGVTNLALSSKRDLLNAEADGTGGTKKRGLKDIWRSKYAMYKADSTEMGNQNGLRLNEINKIEAALASNARLRDSQIANLPNEISTGINKNMELLHKVILLDGNFTNIFMALLILIISMIFELAPLISKSFYDTSEYFARCATQRDIKDKESILVKSKDLNIVGRRVILEQKQDEVAMVRENAENRLLETIRYNKIILSHTTDELNRLESIDIRLKLRFPRYHETHIKPVIERSYVNLHNAAQAAISNISN